MKILSHLSLLPNLAPKQAVIRRKDSKEWNLEIIVLEKVLKKNAQSKTSKLLTNPKNPSALKTMIETRLSVPDERMHRQDTEYKSIRATDFNYTDETSHIDVKQKKLAR